MPSMFSVRDPVAHQARRRQVAQKLSLSSIKAHEPFADGCTHRRFEGLGKPACRLGVLASVLRVRRDWCHHVSAPIRFHEKVRGCAGNDRWSRVWPAIRRNCEPDSVPTSLADGEYLACEVSGNSAIHTRIRSSPNNGRGKPSYSATMFHDQKNLI